MNTAWTLGYPPAYDQAVLVPGNAKAPGGYAFRTRKEAITYARTHSEAKRYGPYKMYLPGTFRACTTTSYEEAAQARHRWHSLVYMPQCGVCNPRPIELDCSLLLVEAPFQK